jgi:hypothetical protein
LESGCLTCPQMHPRGFFTTPTHALTSPRPIGLPQGRETTQIQIGRNTNNHGPVVAGHVSAVRVHHSTYRSSVLPVATREIAAAMIASRKADSTDESDPQVTSAIGDLDRRGAPMAAIEGETQALRLHLSRSGRVHGGEPVCAGSGMVPARCSI